MNLSVRKAGSLTFLSGSSVTRLITAALFFGVSVAAIVIGVTGAVFTDTESVGANTFTAGTVDIAASPASAVVAVPFMAPGDETVGELTVSNDGSLELRYAVTATTTENVMAADLDLTIKTGVTTCTIAGFSTDGSIIYGPDDLGSTAGIDVIGDPTQGDDTGDRVLSGAGSETLCLRVALPISIGNSSQGVTTTAQFNFAAEQTANN